MFICGSRSFSHEDRDKTLKTSKKSKSFSRFIGKDNSKKNPYADRGLDKFYTLLSHLDDKKQKIYNQMGVEEISFVRFVYSEDSKRLRPIVVKVKNKNSEIKLRTCNPAAVADGLGGKSCEEIDDRSKEKGTTTEEKKEELMKIYRRWNGRLMSRSYYCFAVMIVLILLFLAIYGRSFAILCTTITWYLAPRINVGGSGKKH